jgi:hypothetical protein
MDRNRKTLQMIERNNRLRFMLGMARVAMYGITGIVTNVSILTKAASGMTKMESALGIVKIEGLPILWAMISLLTIIGIEMANAKMWELIEIYQMKKIFPELSQYSQRTLSRVLERIKKVAGSELLKGPDDELASLEIENIVEGAAKADRRISALNPEKKKLFTALIEWIRREVEEGKKNERRIQREDFRKTNQYLKKKGLPEILDTRKELKK